MGTPADRRQVDTDKIWQRYHETGDPALRDQLVGDLIGGIS